MTTLTTKQLTSLQIEPDNALDATLKSIAMNRRLQETIRDIVQVDGDTGDVNCVINSSDRRRFSHSQITTPFLTHV
jgi:hypothetical protein